MQNTNVTVADQNAVINSNVALFDSQYLNAISAFAQIMAQGAATVPRHLQGNQADCMAVAMQAAQWQMNPFAVAQKTHLINGVLGYEAQLVNAVISRSGVLANRFEYEWYGPWEKVVGKFQIRKGDKGEYRVPGWTLADETGIGIIIRATLKGEDQPRELDLLLAQARTRNSTLWADDPRQQLAYLAVKRWARLFCPDVILGVYTPDELDDRREEREVSDAVFLDPIIECFRYGHGTFAGQFLQLYLLSGIESFSKPDSELLTPFPCLSNTHCWIIADIEFYSFACPSVPVEERDLSGQTDSCVESVRI